MDSKSHPRVLIAGAGPCGLVLALTLRQNGIPVRIIDKSTIPAIGQRGFGIQPRTQELFQMLGIIDQINAQSRIVPPFRSYAPEGRVPLKTWESTPTLDPVPAFPYRNLITLGQNHLEGILRADLAEKYSCAVDVGKTLVSFTQDVTGVDVTIQDEIHGTQKNERYDFLVGTDGARGVVRKQLGLSFVGESRPSVQLIIADVRGSGIDEDHWHMWGSLQSDGLFVRPTGVPGLFGLAMTLSGEKVDCEVVKANPALLQDFIQRVVARTEFRVTEVEWITNWTPNIRMVDKLSLGRCFVAGDAAHVHSPTGGQGLNTAVQEAFNLGWKMALVVQGNAPLSLLDSYNEERIPIVEEMLLKTTNLLDQTMVAKPGERKHWDRGGALLMLGINYRWSAVVLDEQDAEEENNSEKDPYGVRTTGLRAGDRAPDATGLKENRSAVFTQLSSIFGVAHHTVLLFSASTERCTAVLEALVHYPANLIHLVVVQATPAPLVADGEKRVLEDTQGHTYAAYDPILKAGCDIVIVRGSEGVGRYFGRILL
ncbi:FAD binding domain-containing protein [Mycena rosella]|uniref:FAD binding domain-containing protein n=1 Tax=Mycena rosella TaxID=1033263 RepID=A0AAD7M8F0_MYCRO|nr:FAD binding domain-containing protein [Mycena rosella]